MLWHWQDDVLTLKVCCWLRVGYPSGFLRATLCPVKPTNRVSRPKVIEIAGNRFLAGSKYRKLFGGRLRIGQLGACAGAQAATTRRTANFIAPFPVPEPWRPPAAPQLICIE